MSQCQTVPGLSWSLSQYQGIVAVSGYTLVILICACHRVRLYPGPLDLCHIIRLYLCHFDLCRSECQTVPRSSWSLLQHQIIPLSFWSVQVTVSDSTQVILISVTVSGYTLVSLICAGHSIRQYPNHLLVSSCYSIKLNPAMVSDCTQVILICSCYSIKLIPAMVSDCTRVILICSCHSFRLYSSHTDLSWALCNEAHGLSQRSCKSYVILQSSSPVLPDIFSFVECFVCSDH